MAYDTWGGGGGGAHCDMIISVTQNMTKLLHHLIDGLSKNHVFTDMRELGNGSATQATTFW